MLVQQTDATIIRHDDPVESPLFTQNGGQQEAIAVPRLIINIVVSGHHRTGICQLHRHFKWQQKSVVQLAKTQMYRRMVARPFAERVTDVMLKGRQQIAFLPL